MERVGNDGQVDDKMEESYFPRSVQFPCRLPTVFEYFSSLLLFLTGVNRDATTEFRVKDFD